MILLDTNVLARAIQKGHQHQRAALDAVAHLRMSRREVLVIVPQVLIEFYAVCTRSQNSLSLTSENALAEIDRLKQAYPLFPETPAVLPQWESLVGKYKVTNRRVYDLRLVAFMLVHNIPQILSFNDQDFVQFAEIQVLNPFDVIGIPRV